LEAADGGYEMNKKRSSASFIRLATLNYRYSWMRKSKYLACLILLISLPEMAFTKQGNSTSLYLLDSKKTARLQYQLAENKPADYYSIENQLKRMQRSKAQRKQKRSSTRKNNSSRSTSASSHKDWRKEVIEHCKKNRGTKCEDPSYIESRKPLEAMTASERAQLKEDQWQTRCLDPVTRTLLPNCNSRPIPTVRLKFH